VQENGLKRHILVHALSVLLNVVVHPADIRNRDDGYAGRYDYSRSIERIRLAVNGSLSIQTCRMERKGDTFIFGVP
jgi:hypothetical protein